MLISMKGNLKCPSGNSLSQLGVQNKDLSPALETLLTEVKLRLQCRLETDNKNVSSNLNGKHITGAI